MGDSFLSVKGNVWGKSCVRKLSPQIKEDAFDIPNSPNGFG